MFQDEEKYGEKLREVCSTFSKIIALLAVALQTNLQKNAFSQLLKDCGVLETAEINVLDSLVSKALRISDCDRYLRLQTI